MTEPLPQRPRSSVIRKLPLWILLAAAAAVAAIWLWPEWPRQQRNLRTAITLIITFILLLIWLVVFSGLRWKVRLGVLAGLGLAGFALSLAFQIRGVSGDLVPILEPRWQPAHRVAAPVNPGVPSGAPSAPSAATQVASTLESESTAPGFPQFYGPSRNGVIGGLALETLETNWAAFPPEIVWRTEVGPAWSGFSLSGSRAVTQEQREQQEAVVCRDLLTGQTLWTHLDEARYFNTLAGEGPRATPSISSNRVVSLGATGILNCLDLHTGRRLWSRDCARELRAPLPTWGFASSPLILNDLVVVSLGAPEGSLAAFALEDGQLRWISGTGPNDYSSPIPATFGGVPQILIFNGSGVVAHDLNGPVLWQHPWPGQHPHISLPVPVEGGRLLVSSGYGVGAELISVTRTNEQWQAARLWKSIALKSKFGPIFVLGGYAYGLDDGMLACVDLSSGQRVWKEGRYGHGQGLLLGDLLLLSSERGALVLIQLNPGALRELAQFPVLSHKTWNPPALAGQLLLMRNDREAACVRLRFRPVAPKS